MEESRPAAMPPTYSDSVPTVNEPAGHYAGQTIETINSGRQMEVVQNVAPPPQQQLTPLSLLREHPESIYCPQQGRIVKTRADSKDSDKTWLAVFGFALICICLACVPLKGCCGDGMFQDWDQYCEGCGKQVTHRPYNKEAQVLAPDHDVRNGSAPGWQGNNAQPMQQPSQMAYQPQGQPQQPMEAARKA